MNRKVLIADDEPALREGIKTIIDWNACGFDICGEASNGMETLEKILALSPDLVLLDIKMPKLNGIEVARRARNKNFGGNIIILSGYSDFSYAQSAISCGVDFYLLKPIDEDDLIKAVTEVRKKLDSRSRDTANLAKAKEAVLADLLQGKKGLDTEAVGLKLNADAYQAVIVDMASAEPQHIENFYAFLKRAQIAPESMEWTLLSEKNVFLLKGSETIRRLSEMADTLEQFAKSLGASPIFIAAGRIVQSVREISLSYEDAKSIQQKRFFCDEKQKYLSYDQLQLASNIKEPTAVPDMNHYADMLFGWMEAANTEEISQAMGRLYDELRFVRLSPENIRSILSSTYIRIKSLLHANHKQLNLTIPTDEEIIAQVCSRRLLYEILVYLKAELLRLTSAIAASGSTMDMIIHYINAHYAENLKLESLSKKFGYNPAYLGKAIRNTVGETFNAYLEKVRIEEAKKLLLTDLKVYEISERTGFTDMDSFYKKFKKVTGQNPGEYRKNSGI